MPVECGLEGFSNRWPFGRLLLLPVIMNSVASAKHSRDRNRPTSLPSTQEMLSYSREGGQCSAETGSEVENRKASEQTGRGGGGLGLKSWGGLLLSPFVVAAPITVPDSFGVIKDNEKPLLLMLFSPCVWFYIPR